MKSNIITKTHVDEKIKKLRELAKKHNYSVKFVRHKKFIDEEFVIFLYNREIKKNGYIIGFDGNWLASKEYMENFDRCVGSAAHYMNKDK